MKIFKLFLHKMQPSENRCITVRNHSLRFGLSLALADPNKNLLIAQTADSRIIHNMASGLEA